METVIRNVISPDADSDPSPTGSVLCNFWRSAKNFVTIPTKTQNGYSNTMLWAVSKVIINANLHLYESTGYYRKYGQWYITTMVY